MPIWSPVARVTPHALTAAEKEENLKAAAEPELANERHRNLTHHLSCQERVWCSESSTLKVLRAAGKVPEYERRSRLRAAKAEVEDSEPNQTWRYDITDVPTRPGLYHLIPVLDSCSRKILDRYYGPKKTSSSVQMAWDKPLAVRACTPKRPSICRQPSPTGYPDDLQVDPPVLHELGVTQIFSRPHTPADNASCEAWIATIKCKRLLPGRMLVEGVCVGFGGAPTILTTAYVHGVAIWRR